METKLELLRNEVAETYRVYELEWWMTLLMAVGAVSLVCLFVAGFLHLVRDRRDPDIHPSVLCICRNQNLNPKCPLRYADSHLHYNRAAKRQHTATLSVVEQRNPKGDAS